MPVLQREPFIYPDALLSEPAELPTAEWWVLHTRSRVEKSIARKLLSRNVSFFLPWDARPLPSRQGKSCSYAPLFPGYVFLYGDVYARQIALETNQIASCLKVVDQNRLWSDLTQVYRILQNGESLRPENRLQPGQLVEIVAGPLEGLRGKWLRQGTKGRFFVEVDMLQQGVSIEIDEWMIDIAR
ncbi:hypothetical protein KIH39_20225 [Telmatocola sphagniphila]|jgi:transcription antitermination factor NusG|uniref:NusG-like N-terminal domain-containing protein n=1 Tax=Telmatocola sphagniphila TaxID=1123043 RepID=A0A8E6B3F7_9BACT|nr:transcription termination/antitermination NusG family protein [Telmatocola sphagniphila]QVL31152.1 hypothetical protein KIH39_20225 [Telmatocola sphagniphila]